MHGLARECGPAIDILAVVSEHPGQGHFRSFVKELQEHYPSVRFYEIANRKLYVHLRSLGFNDFEEWGVTGPNVVWEKPV